ncbi:MAG: RsmB/NOP family class I SAM-dependent RNA methyltransferase [Planctomycetota bacterium]
MAFVDRLREIVPTDRLASVLDSFGADRAVGVRANPSATGAVGEELVGVPVSAVGWRGSTGVCGWVEFAQREAVVRHAAVEAGRVYVQNLSSQLAALALGVEPGMSVLDLAAAPGGKTLHLAGLVGPPGSGFRSQATGLNDGGVLAAVEPVKGRFFRLRANLERGGAGWVKTYMHDGRRVGQKTPERFDRVMLDAPCSAEARIDARDPASFAEWSEKKIKRCARVQAALLRSALQAVKVGGMVLYATCSLAPEENEAVVAGVLERYGDAVELVEWDDGWDEAWWGEGPRAELQRGLVEWRGSEFGGEMRRCVRVLPDEHFPAFFMARLVKRGVIVE